MVLLIVKRKRGRPVLKNGFEELNINNEIYLKDINNIVFDPNNKKIGILVKNEVYSFNEILNEIGDEEE